MLHQVIDDGGWAFVLEEQTLSPDIKPYIIGEIHLRSTQGTRIKYRYEKDGRYGRIIDVVVEYQFQRRGLARRMVRLAESCLKCAGATYVTGYAAPEVHGMWKKFGYRVDPDNTIYKALKR